MNIKKETMQNKDAEKIERKINVQEFCRALVLSRKIDGNIKHFTTEKSKQELSYDGSIYSDYKQLQTLINEDRNYNVKKLSHRYDNLTEDDIELIKSTISQFESLNKVVEHATVPFSKENFINATNEIFKSDKPISYYNLATSGEVGYFRSYVCDYTVLREVVYDKQWSRTRYQKGIREALTEQDIAELKQLFEDGYFYKRLKKSSKNQKEENGDLSEQEIAKIKKLVDKGYTQRKIQEDSKNKATVSRIKMDIKEFSRAYEKFLTLNAGYFVTYDKKKSIELLDYHRSFFQDCGIISGLVRGVSSYSYKLTKEDMEDLKKCGFLNHIKVDFDINSFISVVEFLQEEYGDEFFVRPRMCIDDFTEDRIKKEFGYHRNFINDYVKVRDLMNGRKFEKGNNAITIYESLDKNAEVCLLKVLQGYNSKMQKVFNINDFIIRLEVEGSPYRIVSKADKEYKRDFKADLALVENALSGSYASPEYVLQELTEEKRITIMNLLGKGNVVSRLNEFFKAWDYFIEIPKKERDYRDFYEDLSEDVLEYSYNFCNDYNYIANIYLSLKEDINNKMANATLKPYGITAQAFLTFADGHKFNIEKQYNRKKPATKDNLTEEDEQVRN